jgi:hypothetical protein
VSKEERLEDREANVVEREEEEEWRDRNVG